MINFGNIHIEMARFLAIFCLIIKVADCLQCFNCRGITNYDPNGCFNPNPKTTYLQECGLNEVCEKRVTQVDRLQDVIDRGCSPNCVDGNFVWTDEFQVYCCNDRSLCNSAPGSGRAPSLALLLALPMLSLLLPLLRRICFV